MGVTRWFRRVGGSLVICGVATMLGSCASRTSPPQVHDIMLSVWGTVTTTEGEPVPGAQVALTLQRAVYDATTPVTKAEHTTDALGRFIFTYIAHDASVPYSLSVSKEGFAPQTITASVPPAAGHSIRLSKR